MPQLPAVVVFDVNETLSDMAPLDERFEQVGAPAHLRAMWFASVLRDGFGLAAAGTSERFAVLASSVLVTVLAQRPGRIRLEEVTSSVVELGVQPSALRAVEAVQDAEPVRARHHVHHDDEGVGVVHRTARGHEPDRADTRNRGLTSSQLQVSFWAHD